MNDEDSASVSKTLTVRSSVDFVTRGHRLDMAKITASSFASGMSEAAFLVIVTGAAFALSTDDQRVELLGGRSLTVHHALIVAAALVAARFAFSALNVWVSSNLSTTVVYEQRKRLGRAFLGASWEAQHQQRRGTMQELLSTYASGASGLTTATMQFITALSSLVAMVMVAVFADPIGALVLVGSVSILGLLLRPLRLRVRRRARAAREAGMEYATGVGEVSELGLEVQVFDVAEPVMDRLDRHAAKSRRTDRRSRFAAGLVTPIYLSLAYGAVLLAIAVIATASVSDIGALGAAMLVMLRSLSYGQALQAAITNMGTTSVTVEELRRNLDLFDAARRIDVGVPVSRIGKIEARDVSFAYVPGEDVLRHLTFAIPSREVVGIVGPSGSGKTTLVQLLLRIRRPRAGQLLADGRDIGDYARADWARQVTFVPQSPNMIDGSIADNIRFFRDDVSDQDVERAARLAHVHDDITAFPEGYDRLLGGSRARLSGGQEQRISIARALVEHPSVLILDEPTSALDVRSEHLVRNTLGELRKEMTVIVIAHRLSTLDICDRIMVLQAGELKAFDVPTELRQSNEFYREAVELSGLK